MSAQKISFVQGDIMQSILMHLHVTVLLHTDQSQGAWMTSVILFGGMSCDVVLRYRFLYPPIWQLVFVFLNFKRNPGPHLVDFLKIKELMEVWSPVWVCWSKGILEQAVSLLVVIFIFRIAGLILQCPPPYSVMYLQTLQKTNILFPFSFKRRSKSQLL